ncbi:helix-turn-helix domain-containing protein [uncultured Desulfosarcina sp.]|uniref:helix-turn-helix domain-containing protein n=1 Tax=uncultured Desulfosarcina sp. TaxID=218289 RepID=UPI0029C726FC|nr:helix-turn-helix domain-containing protein [uncultured Desulfosarcina sp.]
MPGVIDIEGALQRIKSIRNISKDKEIAILLDLSPQDFSNRKKRGTLIDPIVRWGINENVDLNWVLNGKKISNREGESTQNVYPEPQTSENLGENQNSVSIAERRKILQNLREGIISNFDDNETARQMILGIAEIEKADRDHFMMLAGEIRGTVRALRPKKRA